MIFHIHLCFINTETITIELLREYLQLEKRYLFVRYIDTGDKKAF